MCRRGGGVGALGPGGSGAVGLGALDRGEGGVTLDPMRFCLMRNKRVETAFFYKPSLTLYGHRSLEYDRNDEYSGPDAFLSYAQQERRMTFFYKPSLTLCGHRSLEYGRNEE